jgi:predicted nucleic acid-binding protein
MPATLIDANILLDVLEDRREWAPWAVRQIMRLSNEGDLVINQIIYSEVSVPYDSMELFDDILNPRWVRREELPWQAAFKAGKVHQLYRAKGGQKLSVLPDFMIGAHAEFNVYRVLTRDPKRFRTYFPEVELVAPDTHP